MAVVVVGDAGDAGFDSGDEDAKLGPRVPFVVRGLPFHPHTGRHPNSTERGYLENGGHHGNLYIDYESSQRDIYHLLCPSRLDSLPSRVEKYHHRLAQILAPLPPPQ